MKDKITVIGSLNYDVILKISRLPKEGETLPADDATFSSGGKGANQAVQAAKLGALTYMVGCVGNDLNGQVLLDTVKGYGVNTEFIKKVDAPSGMGVVNSMEDGSVFSAIVRGANFQITKKQIDDVEGLLEQTKILILQMEIPQEINTYAIDKAKKAGCTIVMNAAPAEAISEEYLKKIDILVVNEVEAAFYLGEDIANVEMAMEAARKICQKYGNSCVITLGKEGAVGCDGKQTFFVPSKKVLAVETTGAGDSFIGGMSYALLENMKLEEACKFATRCSAVTVCRYGAQPSMPTLAEIYPKEN